MDKEEHRDIERFYSGAEEEIAAYVTGEMTPEETAAFEGRMKTHEDLRREVEQWREVFAAAEGWADADPPGIERAEQIKVPPLPIRKTEQLRRVLASFRTGPRPRLATAVVFLAGFLLGALLFRQRAPLPSQQEGTPVEPPVTVTADQQDAGVPPEDEKGLESKRPEPTEPRQEAPETRVAAVSQPRYVTQEDGRVIVETTLQRSGARVVMVVDGAFGLPLNETQRGGEQ